MRNCGVCADAGHAYKLATGIIMCQVSQKFMSDYEACAYDARLRRGLMRKLTRRSRRKREKVGR